MVVNSLGDNLLTRTHLKIFRAGKSVGTGTRKLIPRVFGQKTGLFFEIVSALSFIPLVEVTEVIFNVASRCLFSVLKLCSA